MPKLKVSGSSGEMHEVTITRHVSGSVSVRCSCIAGQKNTMCKHRRAVITGDCSCLEDGQDEVWKEAQALVAENGLVRKLEEYEADLEENKKAQDAILKKVEQELGPLKEEAKQIKKMFAVRLDRGI